jgi:hypothetical protein
MSDATAEVRKLLRQQAAIARLGSFSLRERDLLEILTEAASNFGSYLEALCQTLAERTLAKAVRKSMSC